MRGVDSNKQAGPLCQRPVFKSSVNALVSFQQAQGKGVPHIPIKLRTRQNNTLDPAAQQHKVWLSFNWPTCFSSSSSLTWTESPTWWSSSPWDHQWQEGHSQGWQDKKTDLQTLQVYGDLDGKSERQSLSHCQIHLNPASIRFLAHFSDLFFLTVPRPDSGNCHERDGECTENTSPFAHALFLVAHFTREHVCGPRASLRVPQKLIHLQSCLC